MTGERIEAMWAQLRDAGLVSGEQPADRAHTPWYVRTMLGIAGWIGAMFLLGFVGAAFAIVFRSPGAGLVIGALVCAGATFLFRARPESDFFEQFGLAISIAGQSLICVGLGSLFDSNITMPALAFTLVEVVLFLLIPNFLHRVLASGAAGAALVLSFGQWGFHPFATAIVFGVFAWAWLNEFRMIRQGVEVRSLAYGMTLLMLAALVILSRREAWLAEVFRDGRDRAGSELDVWLGAAAIGAIVIVVVWRLLIRQGVAAASGPGLASIAGAGIVAIVSLKAPGFGIGVTMLLLGFANGNRVLGGLGIASLLSYWSYYYYSLEVTLLQKSAILVSAGIALILARVAMRRVRPPGAAGASDHA